MARLLVAAGATVDACTTSGFTPLQYACQFGHHAALCEMIEVKANVNHVTEGQGWHALFDACMNGHDEIVRELAAAGADINHAKANTGFTGLMLACQNKHEQAAVAMLQSGADPDQLHTRNPSENAVQICVRGDSPTVLQHVLSYGGSANLVRGSSGAAPLHMAAGSGRAECVTLLVRNGADIDAVDREGRAVAGERRGPSGPWTATRTPPSSA